MTCVSYTDARDQIFGLLQADINGQYPIQWPDKANFDPLPAGPWLRVTLRHQTGGQASLAGESGARRWNRIGTLWVQVFTPLGEGNVQNYTLAQRVTQVFEGKATEGGVWFRNVRLNEIGASGAYSQSNVLAEFNYDDIH